MKVVICDIDNCISDDRWRRKFIDPKMADPYFAYNACCVRDEHHVENWEKVKKFAEQKDATIIFITGRPEQFREQTILWIRERLLIDNYKLLMRPRGNVMRSPQLKVKLFEQVERELGITQVVMAYDDRFDVLDAYYEECSIVGITHMTIDDGEEEPAPDRDELEQPRTAADVLQQMADTFRERNARYKDNYKVVGQVMAALFPQGVQLKTEADYNKWHLFELLIVKLTRYAVSDLQHKDSIHDLAVYAAMVEFLTEEKDDE